MQKRVYSLDFLRIIATICIVFHHYQQLTGTYFQRGLNFYGGAFSFGYFVEFFFVLSGFLQYKRLNEIKNGKLNFKDYMIAKFIRLMPMLVLSTGVMALLSVLFHMVSGSYWMDTKPDIWTLFVNFTGLSSGWGLNVKTINNPTWYISVLMLCYIYYYFLAWLSEKIKIKDTYLFIFMVILNLGINSQNLDILMFNNPSSRGLYSFFSGVMLAVILNKISLTNKKVVTLTVCLVFLTYMIGFHFSYMEKGISYIMACIYFPMLTAVFYSDPVSRLFNSKRWMTSGRITFYVYIWHLPVLATAFIISYIFYGTASVISGKAYIMIVYATLCFLIGAILYFTLDDKIERKMKEKCRRQA